MNSSVILVILIAGFAFIAGAAVALTVTERSLALRDRRQALRERELKQVNAIVNKRLAWLADNSGSRLGGEP